MGSRGALHHQGALNLGCSTVIREISAIGCRCDQKILDLVFRVYSSRLQRLFSKRLTMRYLLAATLLALTTPAAARTCVFDEMFDLMFVGDTCYPVPAAPAAYERAESSAAGRIRQAFRRITHRDYRPRHGRYGEAVRPAPAWLRKL